MLKGLLVRLTLIAFLGSISFAAHAIADPGVQVNVPAGDLGSALATLAKQSGVEFVYQVDQVRGVHTGGVRGTYSPHDAVQLLLKGTPLEVRTDPSGAMLIAPPRAMTTSQEKNGGEPAQEGQKSDSFLVAQAATGQDQGASSVEAQTDKSAKETGEKKDQLQQIVVTGSHLATSQGTQPVETYTREDIERTGLSDVADFLSTLPQVSVNSSDSYYGSKLGIAGATTVQLHGMPIGTTLVLINGRRVETSGSLSESDAFDLSTIPVAAIERIEIVPAGASAVYGSDAIAGVVNIILKTDFTGAEIDGKYSWAKDLPQWDSSIALGKEWDKASISLIGTFLNRGTLDGFDRSFSASSDFTAQGGSDARYPICNPGNVYFPNGYTINGQVVYQAAVPQGYKGTPTVQEFAGTAGTQNLCSVFPYASTVPQMKREGAFLSGHYDLTSDLQVFAEVLYSHYDAVLASFPNFLYFTDVPASNAYNPFGEDVDVTYLITGSPYVDTTHSALFRPVLGIRGSFGQSWTWEVTGLSSQDRTSSITPYVYATPALGAALSSSNPATALNPFGSGAPASQQLLQTLYSPDRVDWNGQLTSATAFARGDLFALPAGPAQLVLGSEFDHSSVNSIEAGILPFASYGRESYAVFGETHIPIISGASRGQQYGDYLSLTAAGRYDHFSDFGGKGTPQVGLVWQPVRGLMVKGNYSQAFKAPTLVSLFEPQISEPNYPVVINGVNTTVTEIVGGNPNLKAETSTSHTFSLSYSGDDIPGLKASVTNWEVDLKNDIQSIGVQTIIDNADLFPQYITRSADGTITEVNATWVNFGEIRIGGADSAVSYGFPTAIGTWTPSLQATTIYHYTSALAPGSPEVSVNGHAQDSGVWAPHWKGTVALQWAWGPLAAGIDGRYVGPYQDYDRAAYIGNFWLSDLNFHYSLNGRLNRTADAYIDAGVRNLLNREPQFSNFSGGILGYDPTQSDYIGRLMYVKVGLKL